jgi:hypothetical protein
VLACAVCFRKDSINPGIEALIGTAVGLYQGHPNP